MAKKKFRRFHRHDDKPDRTDDRGKVRIQVVLSGPNGQKTGNITRSLTVADATVSEVFAAIEELVED